MISKSNFIFYIIRTLSVYAFLKNFVKLNNSQGQNPRKAMLQLVREYLDNDISYMSEQKPGETVFEYIPGYIDFLKPSIEEKIMKEACTTCGENSKTTAVNVKVNKQKKFQV